MRVLGQSSVRCSGCEAPWTHSLVGFPCVVCLALSVWSALLRTCTGYVAEGVQFRTYSSGHWQFSLSLLFCED